ncbi:MAG: cysteine peptidase family C39 domain-containing protein [Methanothermobacter sp.]|nr:cysteine peptidase family C39 domain-containing protein [Methanothermobacter sp.]
MKCPRCGAYNNRKANFCRNCGTKLAKRSEIAIWGSLASCCFGIVFLIMLGAILTPEIPQEPYDKIETINGYTIVYQTTDYTCGPASLATALINKKGANLTEKRIVDYLGNNPHGYNAYELVKVAEHFGYNASIQEGPPQKYDIIIIDDGALDIGYECYDENHTITHFVIPGSNGHFTVYAGATPDGFIIFLDPSNGIEYVSPGTFNEIYQNLRIHIQ